MEVRLSGTPGECRAFVQLLKEAAPPDSIRKISRFYINKRPDEPRDQGRVYVTLEIGEA
jgi:hypothetical protein